jgi:hypothetical protein
LIAPVFPPGQLHLIERVTITGVDGTLLSRQPTRTNSGSGEHAFPQQCGEWIAPALDLFQCCSAHSQPDSQLNSSQSGGFPKRRQRMLNGGRSRHECTLLGVIMGANRFADADV